MASSPTGDQDGDHDGEKRQDRTGQFARFVVAIGAEQFGVAGNERRRQRAFPEEILQKIGNPERRAPDVHVGADAEVLRQHPLADQPGDATEKDACRDEIGAASAHAGHHAATASTTAVEPLPVVPAEKGRRGQGTLLRRVGGTESRPEPGVLGPGDVVALPEVALQGPLDGVDGGPRCG